MTYQSKSNWIRNPNIWIFWSIVNQWKLCYIIMFDSFFIRCWTNERTIWAPMAFPQLSISILYNIYHLFVHSFMYHFDEDSSPKNSKQTFNAMEYVLSGNCEWHLNIFGICFFLSKDRATWILCIHPIESINI